MRVPPDPPQPSATARPRSGHRLQVGIVVAVIAIILIVIALQQLADFYTNYLWYRSVHFTMVWRLMIETKLALVAVFAGSMFIATWISLWVVDRIAPRALLVSPELEIVRRYQQLVGRHTFALRTIVALVLALIVGLGTANQWQNWLLFLHGKPFDAVDPQFHKNVAFFVFRLPFLTFLLNWSLVALLLLLLVTLFGHYLNGALRFQGPSPRIDRRVIAHASLILGLMAFVRAMGYFFIDRYALELRTDGYVDGMGYTDAHVRLPAIELLTVVALVAFVLLIVNVYQRSLALPIIGGGLWAFVALVVGVIFPAAVQAFVVTPAQSRLEKPYIERNILATRAAMNLASVNQSTFPGNNDLNAAVVDSDDDTLDNLPLWDTSISQVQSTFSKLQQNGAGFALGGLSIDRYMIRGKLTPVVIGVREVQTSDLNNQSWVNTHLAYTHGYGAVISPGNSFSKAGTPNFVVGSVPPQSSDGAPVISQPSVYFGLGETGFVVANTSQREVDYVTNGGSHYSHYEGSGGVQVSSIWTKAALALRFHDLNLLISNLITPQSRVLFFQDVRARVAKVAPFLEVDPNPYPVVADGQIDWVVDAYTTSSYYPYGEQTGAANIPGGNALQGSTNYIRNSVKVVVNAYTGNMTFYAVDPSDPVLQTWETIFPNMFLPMKDMSPTLQAHLRYPQNLLQLQSAMYGQYHLTNPSSFYSGNNAWQLAPTSGNGSPSEALPTDIYGNTIPFFPEYEILQLPGQSNPGFKLVEPLDPRSSNNSNQTLSALLVASCDAAHYGQIVAYVTPPQNSVNGPAIVNSRIQANRTVSREITYVNQQGSTALLGTTLIIPIADSLVYVRPLYVSSSTNQYPVLTYIIVVYGSQVAMEPTIGEAFADVFGASTANIGSGGSGAIPAAVRALLAEANQAYVQGQAALKRGDFAAYGTAMQTLASDLAQAKTDLAAAKAQKSGSSTPSAGSSTSGSGAPGSGTSSTSGSASNSASTTTTAPSGTTTTSTTTLPPSQPSTSPGTA